MQQDYSLRRAGRSDLGVIADIERRAAARFPAARVPDPQQTLSTTVLNQAIAEDLLIAADTEDGLVGFGAGAEVDGWLHLIEVSVDPAFGQRGIGRSLVASFVQTAADRGLKGVSLTTFSDIQWNAPFYARMGFVATPAEALPAHVRAHLEAEAAAGLSHRVGMLRPSGTNFRV